MSENNNSNTPWSTALENIAKFANLLKSYALKWYDMYFNPTPKDVEVDKIADDSDELTTVTVPNLAKIKQTFDTWKDTVQPQITALDNRVGYKISYLNKTTSVDPDTTLVYDPDIASQFSSSFHYGGYHFDSPEMLFDGKSRFFDIEIYVDVVASAAPLYGRALVKIMSQGTQYAGAKVIQLHGGVITLGAIGIEDVNAHGFSIVFCGQVSNTALQLSDIPDPINYFCKVRELNSDFYDEFDD